LAWALAKKRFLLTIWAAVVADDLEFDHEAAKVDGEWQMVDIPVV